MTQVETIIGAKLGGSALTGDGEDETGEKDQMVEKKADDSEVDLPLSDNVIQILGDNPITRKREKLVIK